MGHRDLGDFYRSISDYNASLKSYTKSREFCTTSQHVVDMCISILQVRLAVYAPHSLAHIAQLLIEQRNYAHIGTYVFKAEAALDAAGSKNDQGSKSSIVNRESVQIKLDFSTALGCLGQGNYNRAAYGFLKLGHAKGLGDWLGTVTIHFLSLWKCVIINLISSLWHPATLQFMAPFVHWHAFHAQPSGVR
jgi:COP9 signalosome complex subunit 1